MKPGKSWEVLVGGSLEPTSHGKQGDFLGGFYTPWFQGIFRKKSTKRNEFHPSRCLQFPKKSLKLDPRLIRFTSGNQIAV